MSDKMSESSGEQMDALLRRFELPLLQYATRILGDRDRARDVVQETFVKLQRDGISTTRPAPAKWLFTVCRNGALNVCRKEKRMTYLDEEILERARARTGALRADRSRKKRADSSSESSRTLPPRQQEVMQLKFQNDLSYQQISEITKLSVSNVGVLIHTALKTLRQRYGQASKEFFHSHLELSHENKSR